MSDVFTKLKRSQVMGAIRSKGNKDTELKLLKILRKNGIKGWRRHFPLPGKPDFIFRKERLALYVDGCFWHGCPKHGRQPASNFSYWLLKLQRNKARDRKANKILRLNGWHVIRIWEHDLKNEGQIVLRIKRLLKACRDSGN